MKVISTELLLQTAHEAMFEENCNFDTDIEHVIDFLQLMANNHGFNVVRCKDCVHAKESKDKDYYYCMSPWANREVTNRKEHFCSHGKQKYE